MELTTGQVAILGVVAVLITQAIKLYAARKQQKIDRKVVTVLLFIVAVPMAYAFAQPALPVLPAASDDPAAFAQGVMDFAGQLIVAASGIVGVATMIYNWLAQRVFAKLGWIADEQIPF